MAAGKLRRGIYIYVMRGGPDEDDQVGGTRSRGGRRGFGMFAGIAAVRCGPW